MADAKKKDVVTTGDLTGDAYPEGSHPLHPLSEQTHAAVNLEYRDMPDDRKPDPSSIVEEQILSGDEASAK